MISESESIADVLTFLFSENQLFEGEDINAGWSRLDARVTALFRKGQQEGDFRLDLSPEWLAEALYGLIASWAWAAFDGRVAPRSRTHMVTELLLSGAQPPRPI
ncbi:hypothetical protein [Nocardia heshunensis]